MAFCFSTSLLLSVANKFLLLSSLTLYVRLSRRWACFCQSMTEINIAVQQLDEVDREVKLLSHIGGGHYVHYGAWTFANGSNRETRKTRNRRERGSL